MYVLGIALAVTLVDQLSKMAVQQEMVLHESIPVIPGFFHITYILNRGAAFGILENQQWLFLVIALILFLLYALFHKKLPHSPWVYGGTGMLLGGALGNALDRTLRGAVTDFFDFRIWPVFNVADIGIVVGVMLLLWYSWTHISDK
ncbi:MAG: signal peptidase II [Megasphaera sp.]|uniref:signal peptidase II n=1 Tax=Megasphaera sp. TaxID=2023260 RepID=UPI003521E511